MRRANASVADYKRDLDNDWELALSEGKPLLRRKKRSPRHTAARDAAA